MPRLKFVLQCHLEEVKSHQNSIIYKTYGGIGIDQKFVAECGINVNFRRNGGMVDPGKPPSKF